jgi:hypothetical protein
MPPAPTTSQAFSIRDLLEIERLSRQGLNADTIAGALKLTPAAFHAACNADPRAYDSMIYGRTRGIDAVSKTLYGAASSGKDSSASRFYLERVAGANFAPPRVSSPTIIISPSNYQPDRADMCRRFARQSLLLDGVIDVEPGAPADGQDATAGTTVAKD